MNDTVQQTAWREPMLWLVWGLPLCVVAAAVITIGVALHSPFDASAAQTRRIAQMQLEDLSADREAARLQLRADLRFGAARDEVIIAIESPFSSQEVLELALLHPTAASHDRHVELQHESAAWRATLPRLPTHAWELRVQPRGGQWRLSGRLHANASQATLRSSVETPR